MTTAEDKKQISIDDIINHSTSAPERKSALNSFSSSNYISFPEYLLNSGHEDLAAFAAIVLYKRVMPFFNAVSLRAEAFANIPIRLFDKSTNQFIESHPVLDLLEQPNSDTSKLEFCEQIASYYDITGDSLIITTGRPQNPPLELATVGPQLTDFPNNPSRFGLLNVPDEIRVTRQEGGQLHFFAQEDKNLGLRYINNQKDKEIWHMRTFNPLRSATKFRGMSRAQPIWMELQQYLSGNTTNLSNLKRGTRLTMAWVNNSDIPLTSEQWDRMQEEAQKYAGDLNAGGTPILDGMDVKPIQQTNREMQFKDLQEAMLSRISSTYRIPLALLLPQSMTLNNLEVALLQLFDLSVLPLTRRLYNELTRFLLPRYPNSENLEFRFNEQDIPALRIRMLESAKAQRDIGANTTDELRTVIGYEALQSGGDQVLVNSNLIPLGSDEFTEDNLDKPSVTSKYRLALYERGLTKEQVDEACKNLYADKLNSK